LNQKTESENKETDLRMKTRNKEKQHFSSKIISIPIEEQIIGSKVKMITHSEEHKELLREILSRKIIIPLNLSWNGRTKHQKRKMSEVSENSLKRRKISIDSHSTSHTENVRKISKNSPPYSSSRESKNSTTFEVNKETCRKLNQDHLKENQNCSIETTKRNNVSSSDCKVILETEKKIFYCNLCNASYNKITF
jgi:hypothetical protein